MNAFNTIRLAGVIRAAAAAAALVSALWSTPALSGGNYTKCLNGVKVECSCDGAPSSWDDGCVLGTHSGGAPGTEASGGLYTCGLLCGATCDGNYVNHCTPPKPCNPAEECCPDIGDPATLVLAQSMYAHTDARLSTSLGPLKLSRYYLGADHFWQEWLPTDRVPKPFGSTDDAGTTLRWWHNFYSFVFPPGNNWHVYGPNGYEQYTAGCYTPPCWASQPTPSQRQRNRLHFSDAGFEYYDDSSGSRYLYHSPYKGPDNQTRYFLTQVQNSNYTTIALVSYQQPDGGCPVAGTGSAAGTPYIHTIESLGGGQWTFEYKPLQWPGSALECVLDRVTAAGPGGEVEVVHYDYVLDGGVEMPGFLRGANWETDSEEYDYTNGFRVDGGASELATVHTYDSNVGHVVAQQNATQDLRIYLDGGPWAVTDLRAGLGDGTTNQPNWTQRIWPGASDYEAKRYRTLDSCGDNSCSEGAEYANWYSPTSPNQAGYLASTQNKRGYFSVYFNQLPDAGIPIVLNERYEVARGATNVGGSGALESTRYTYVYGPNYEQLVSTETRNSVLSPGQETTRLYKYELPTSMRLAAEYETGYTLRDGGVVQKVVGTFYLTSRNGGTADPLGRTLEMRGPCFVTTTDDADCDLSAGPFPVTQYAYDGDGGRLQKVSRCTELDAGACTASLDTTYDSYDALGHPTQETDPNGVVTTRTYSGDLKTSETVTAGGDSWTTNFGYDHGKLTWRQSPNGGYEVFCYRDANLGSACSSGTWTGRLHWKTKASSSDGTGYSEAIDYEYWPDGTVKTERTLLPGEVVRTTRKYAVDAHRRPTWDGFGGNQGAAEKYHAARGYNGNDLVTAVGPAFNVPPAFCANDTYHLCSRLDYDRADRLSSLVEYSTSSQGSQTCFGHDVHGNTTEIVAGLSPSDSCLDGGTLNTSLDMTMVAKYRYDDFANLVAVTLPWTGSGGGGTAWYEYDAAGHETRTQTPSLAPTTFIESTYDPLGRLTQKQSTSGGVSTVLYQFQYDTGQPDSSCPQVQYTAGRMARRVDSFGSTWMSYDARGHVTKEIRIRVPQTTCTGPSDNPHTTYAYTTNGALASITYPHGRTVTYRYPGAGALEDRIESIDVSTFLADGGTSTVTPITSVLWEPYGGLRGYQMQHPSDGTSTLEYMLGDDASAGPEAGSECPATPPDQGSGNDHTGRLRALRVSDGAFDAGASSGDIYMRTYTWSADQVSRTDTCLAGGEPLTEWFSYDQQLRLTSAQATSGNYPPQSGNYSSRVYGYDSRSNRLADAGINEDGMGWYLSYSSGSLADRLTQASSWADSRVITKYTFDDDGRVAELDRGLYQSGTSVQTITFAYGPSTDVATDSVFKSVTVNGATYDYYYDAFGRRRLKANPLGAKTEYFYDLDHLLLADQGDKDVAPTTRMPIDDYVWLDGRPVVMVRGQLDGDWARQPDSTQDCAKDGDAAACGFYFPVTDHIGKPVLVLDSSAMIAGVGEYDPFGHVNRSVVYAGSPHPYSNSQTSALVADLTQSPGAQMALDMRVVFAVLDQEVKNGSGTEDRTWIEDGDTGTTLDGPYYGRASGAAVSAWMTPDAGHLKVRYTSDSTNCCDNGAGCSVLCSCKPNCPYAGASVDHYEYRRHQVGAAWFWTPLGFPGQYYDQETDLFENWNRYYDPAQGRYLQPEPLAGKRAITTPAFAYAGSNPLIESDPTGLYRVGPGPDCSTWYTALKKALETAGCAGTKCNDIAHNHCQARINSCTKGCDICQILAPGEGPEGTFDNRGQLTRKNNEVSGDRANSGFGGSSTSFNNQMCKDPSWADVLASTIIHEALHHCNGGHGKGISDYAEPGESGCSANSLERYCTGISSAGGN